MSHMQRFLTEVVENQELAAALQGALAKTDDQAQAVQVVATIAKQHGFDIDSKEFEPVIASMLRDDGELSDEDLEDVAGGLTIPNQWGGAPMRPSRKPSKKDLITVFNPNNDRLIRKAAENLRGK